MPATELDQIGMGIDFKVLKGIVKEAIDKLDHRDLNNMAMFKEVNPSSENIARYLFSELKGPLSHDRYSLYSITILETDTSGLVYYGP